MLRNTGDEPVVLLRADSAAWTLPPREDYRLSHVTGQWSAETQLRRDRLPFGETVLTSRRGITSHHANPWVMLDAGDATEDHGQVWSAALAWSGSWRITVQRTPDGRAGFTGGAGHDGTSLPLGPGEEFTTPVHAGLYSDGGFGAASRAWHAYTLAHVLPHPDEIRPVLYNSWEATGFDVDEAGQKALAARAAALGVELYVMDDGWFGARRSERAGLGDWTPAPDRFPDGLTPLVEEVHRLGMRFGLWVEPEMVNPDSDLYREHPDWVLHFPHRTRTELRNQLVLNFARRRCRRLGVRLADPAGRRPRHRLPQVGHEPRVQRGRLAGPAGRRRPVWTAYVHNLYGVIDRLRADHPGAADRGVQRRRRPGGPGHPVPHRPGVGLRQHRRRGPGRHPARLQPDLPGADHGRLGDRRARTSSPAASVPLRFRFHVAMAGVLGIGGDLTRWSDEELRRGRRPGGRVQAGTPPRAARHPAPAARPGRRRPRRRAVHRRGPERDAAARLAAGVAPWQSPSAAPAGRPRSRRPLPRRPHRRGPLRDRARASTGCSPSCPPATGPARRCT